MNTYGPWTKLPIPTTTVTLVLVFTNPLSMFLEWGMLRVGIINYPKTEMA